MVPTPPTRRELALASLLFILFTLFTVNNAPSISESLPEFVTTTINNISSFQTPLELHKPRTVETRLNWGSSTPPETNLLSHVPGWTILNNLYILNGTVYIASDHPSTIPDLRYILSRGIFIEDGNKSPDSRLPTLDDIQVITTKEARELFGTGAHVIDGVSFLVNDPPQYVTHYYHWAAELWFGFWRTYASLDLDISAEGNTNLPPARRILFNHLDNYLWRDYASMNQWVLRSSFPSVVMEFKDDWIDRAEMGRPFVFERVVVADRSAAMLSYNYARYQRTAGSANALPGNLNWWQPIRNNIVEFAGVDHDAGSGTSSKPVITYISRQKWGRRMLKEADHKRLVEALEKLRNDYGYEVNIVTPENMSRVDQIRLAARTTILMGVHGNGLTSLLWMNPNPRSTVIEFFFPRGFAHDYEYTTRALGMVHYGFWDAESFTSPNLPLPHYVEGFQGSEIPINADAVIALCLRRLSLNEEVDD